MIDNKNILVTGGSGLLGGELKKCHWKHETLFPDHAQLDVTDYESLKEYFSRFSIGRVLHAAAFTSPPLVDKEPMKGLDVNIGGTVNMVKVCHEFDCRLIYISTDYIFSGNKGNYAETDEFHPVNKYAWSKLGGECAVRLLDKSLIIRTSFGPNKFPFPKAFQDQWTSREPVSVIAEKIKLLTESDVCGVIHIGSKRRTVYDYAISLGETKVEKISIKDMNFIIPKDTSLNTEKYNRLMKSDFMEK